MRAIDLVCACAHGWASIRNDASIILVDDIYPVVFIDLAVAVCVEAGLSVPALVRGLTIDVLS